MSVRVEATNDYTASNKNFEFRWIKSLEDPANSDGSVKGSPNNSTIEVSNTYGVTFILHNGNLRVIETNKLLTLETLPPVVKRGIDTIALSCDDHLIATTQGSTVNIYDTKIFCQQLGNANPNSSFIVSKVGAPTKQLAWNPTDVRLIAALGQDGTVLNVRILDNWAIDAVSAIDSAFRCMSWSPKGKQLAVGGMNGIVQLKLDLKEAKKIALPSADFEPISILWMSTLQFLVTFKPQSVEDIAVMLLTLSKTAETVYRDMGDIFLSEEYTDAKVSHKLIPQWKLYFIFSSTTQEVVVASSDPSQNSDFVVQLIEDKYRAALPLDNYIQGAGLFFGYNEPLANVEPPQSWPILLLLSQTGLVSIFHLVNNGGESININVPQPISINLGAAANTTTTTTVAAHVQPSQQQQPPPSFNLNTNLFGQPGASSTPIATSTSLPSSNLFGTTSFNFTKPAPASSQAGQPLSFFGSSLGTTTTSSNIASTPQSTGLFTTTTSQAQSGGFATDPRLAKSQAQTQPPTFASSIASQQQQQQKPPLFSSQSSIFGTQNTTPTVAPGLKSTAPNLTNTSGEPSLKSFNFAPKVQVQQQGSLAGAGDAISQNNVKASPLGGSSSSSLGDGKLPTSQDIQDVKQHLKTYEFKSLLDQLCKFEHRLSNFKRAQAQQITSQSELVKNYFNELDTKVRKELNSVTDFCHNIVETTAGQKEEIDGLCTMLQSHFSKIEYGLVAAEKRMDSKYLQLLRSQPIDPASLSKLNRVDKEFAYVSSQLRECRRHFYYEEQNLRPLDRRATAEFIYKALQQHAAIIQHVSNLIADLKMEVGGCRKSLMDEGLNNSGTTLSSDVTLDDLASGIRLVKLKDRHSAASSPNLMAQFKKTTTFNRDKVASLRRWASQQTVTRVPVTGAIDPFLEIKPRRIRLGEESDKEERSISSSKTEQVDSGSNKISGSHRQPTTTNNNIPSVQQNQTISKPPPPQQQQQLNSSQLLFNNNNQKGLDQSSILNKPTIVSSTASITTPQVSFFGVPICSPLTTKSTPATSSFPSFFNTAGTTVAATAPASSGSTTITFSAKPLSATQAPIAAATSQPSKTSGAISFGTPSSSISSSTDISSSKSVTITPVQPSSTTANTTTTTSLFGIKSPSPAVSTSSSLFGGLTITPVNTSSSSGASTTTPSFFNLSSGSSSSVIKPSTTTTTSGSGTSSLFGSLSFSTPSTGTSGTSTSIASSSTTTATTTTSSFFGFSLPAASTASSSSTSTPATTSSFFGSSPILSDNKSAAAPPPTTTTSMLAGLLSSPPAVSSSTSLFGGSKPSTVPATVTVSSAPSIFGSPLSTTTTTASAVSITPVASSVTTASSVSETTSATPPPLFGGSTISSTTTSTPSIFGTGSLFGSLPSTTTTTTPSTTSISAVSTTPTPTTSTSLFGVPSSTPSIFGSTQAQAPPEVKPAAATTTSVPSPSASSLFGSLSVSPTTTSSTAATSATTSATTTSGGSIFGSPTVSTGSSLGGGGLFGAGAGGATTTTPVVQPGGSIFGGAGTSIFGGGATITPINTTTTTTTSSLFGGSGSSTTTSVFGGGGGVVGASPAAGDISATKPPSGLFGSVTAGATGSVFGSPSFGSPTGAGAGSPFGGQQTTVQGGQQTASVFGGSPFGSGTSSPSTGILKPATSIFGQPQQPSQGLFGSPQAGVATPTTTATSAFGAAPTFGSSPVFGGSPAFGSALKPSAFGSNSIFGGTSSLATTSSFGTLASSTTAPVFSAQAPAFGSTSPQQSSAFGGATTFGGAPSFGGGAAFGGSSGFGSGGGGGAFGQSQPQVASVFASTSTSPTTSSTSTFGLSQSKLRSPAFGGGAVFGGSPAFGTQTQSTFGSGSSIFGGGQQAAGVSSFGNLAGASTSQNAPVFGSQPQAQGFGATQQSAGFGSFGGGSFGAAAAPAQQQQQPAFGQPSFGSFGQGQQAQAAPQKASFGGNSFSSWR